MKTMIKTGVIFTLSALMLMSCSSTTSNSSNKSSSSTSVIKETKTEETKTTAQPEETDDTTTTEEVPGVSSEFKVAMDSYVDLCEQYAEFMKTYDSNDLTMLAKYTELVQKYTEAMQNFEELGNQEMSDEETAYYIDTNAKIQKILLDVQ